MRNDDRADMLGDAALDRMIGSGSTLLALEIPADCVSGVRENLRALLAVALTLSDADKPALPVVEIAPVYRP